MGLHKSNRKKPEHTKTINTVRNNNEKPHADQTNNGAKASKDSVIIVGNSMIKHVNGHDISTVKVRPNLGAYPHNSMDYMKSARKPW